MRWRKCAQFWVYFNYNSKKKNIITKWRRGKFIFPFVHSLLLSSRVEFLRFEILRFFKNNWRSFLKSSFNFSTTFVEKFLHNFFLEFLKFVPSNFTSPYLVLWPLFGTVRFFSSLTLLLLFIDSNRLQKSFHNNLLASCFMAKTIIFITLSLNTQKEKKFCWNSR